MSTARILHRAARGLHRRERQRLRGPRPSAPRRGTGQGELARKIGMLIAKPGLTQASAAELLKIDQPKISALVRGRLAGFSVPERRAGNESDAQLAQQRQQLSLRVAGPQGVLGLQCRKRMRRVGAADGGGASLGQADVAEPRRGQRGRARGAESPEERGAWRSATIRARPCRLLFARADSR